MTPEEEKALEDKAVQEEADALAAFASGYTGQPVAGEAEKAPETPDPDAEANVTAEGEALETKTPDEPKTETPETSTAPSATISKERFDQLVLKANSIDDIRTAVEKLRGDAFGRMGGLERTLKSLQDATPAGQPIELSEDDLAEVKKEYPDLTVNLVTGLSRVLKKMQGTGTAVPSLKIEDVDQRVNERAKAIAQEEITLARTAIREELSIQMLESQHEGWRALVGPKDSDTPYRRWLKAEGTDYETRLLSSNDPVEIGRSIAKFKSAEKTSPKKVEPPKPLVNERKQRLAEAVIPRGGSKPPLPRTKTPEDEFAEGFAYQTAG